MRYFILTILSFCLLLNLQSQAPTWSWLVDVYSASNESALDVAVDPSTEDIYVVGYYTGTSNLSAFFPFGGSNSTNFNSTAGGYGNEDGFVAKYDSDGNLIWAFKIGSARNDRINAITIDDAGDIYITGYFGDAGAATCEFAGTDAPGAGSSLTNINTTYHDFFIAKYDDTGDLQWVKQGYSDETAGTCHVTGLDVATDGNTYVYAVGTYNDNTHFGAITVIDNGANNQSFLVAYDLATGTEQWGAWANNGSGGGAFNGVATDGSDVFVTGFFPDGDCIFYPGTQNIIIFDASATEIIQENSTGGDDIILISYDNSGNYNWHEIIGGNDDEIAYGIVVYSDSIYITGGISTELPGVATFPGTPNITVGSTEDYDFFISAHDKTDGSVGWVKTADGQTMSGPNNEIGTAITIDYLGNLLVSGYVDINNNSDLQFPAGTGADTALQIPPGGDGEAGFMACYGKDGTVLYAKLMESNDPDKANSISSNGTDAVYVVGTFENEIDFDGIFSSTTPGFFTAKLDLTCTPATGGTATPDDDSVCVGGSTNIRLAGYDGTIQWQSSPAGTETWSDMVGETADVLSVTITDSTDYRAVVTPVIACDNDTSNVATVYVYDSPAIYNLTGETGFCTNDGSSATLDLGGSQNGVNYTLYRGGVAVGGTTKAGTGAALSWDVTTAGTYTVRAVHATTTCTSNMNGSVVVSANAPPTVYNLSGPAGICPETASVQFSLSGSQLNVSYDLIKQSNASVHASQPGTGLAINFTVTDTATYFCVAEVVATGCKDTMNNSVTLDYYPASNATTSSDTFICVGGSVQISSNGGAGASYSWSPAAGLSSTIVSNPIASPANTTQYIVTVTNTNGCIDEDTVVVTVIANPTANAGVDDTICNGENFVLNASGGGTYLWNPGAIASKTTTVSPSTTTTYTVLVTNAYGCTDTDDIEIVVYPVPPILVNDPFICNGDTATLTASGATTYLWGSGSTNPVRDVAPAITTDYYVTGFYATGCSAKDTATVTVWSLPTVTSSNDTAICIGSVINLSASSTGGSGGGYTYEWSSSQTGTPITISPVTSTAYTVTVTDGNGCEDTDNTLVTVNNPQTITINNLDPVYCSTVTTFTIEGSFLNGTYTYPGSWGAAIFDDNGDGTADFNPSGITAQGTYTISYEAIGSNGCLTDTSYNVTINIAPTVSFSGLPASICKNAGTRTLTGNPANNNGTFSGSGITNNGNGIATFNPLGLATGNHNITYTYTDPATGCSNSNTQVVNVLATPTQFNMSVSGAGYYCEGTAGATLGLNNGELSTNYDLFLNYTNFVTNTVLMVTPGAFTFNGTHTAGTYSVRATNITTSCVKYMDTLIVQENPLPDNAGPITGDDIITLNGSGTYSVPTITNADNYNWIMPSGATYISGDPDNPTYSFSEVAAGNYTIYVYGSNACGNGDSASFDITIADVPAAPGAVTGTTPVCKGDSNKTYSIPAMPTGATSVSWTVPTGVTINSGNGGTTINVTFTSSAVSGNISARGVNMSGQGSPSSLYVTVNSKPVVTVVDSAGLDCSGNPAIVTASATPVTSTFSWDNGSVIVSATNTLNTSTAGDYTLTVTSTGCSTVRNVKVYEDQDVPQITISPIDTITCYDTSVSITANSIPDHTYLWQAFDGGNILSGASTNQIEVNKKGTYLLTITNDNNSCDTSIYVYNQSNKSAPVFDLSTPSTLTCTRLQVPISCATSLTGVTYSWSGPGIVGSTTNSSINVNAAGTYTLTVQKTVNGCTASRSRTVSTDYTAPTNVSITKSNDLGCDSLTAVLTATCNLGTGATYTWSANVASSSGNTATVNADDTYTVTVTNNATGCTATSNITVNDNTTAFVANISANRTILTCTYPTATLTASSDLTNKSILWTHSGGGSITPANNVSPVTINAAGTYTLILTDTTNGCADTNTVVITTNFTAPTISGITLSPDSITCTSDVQLTAAASGYNSLLWSGPVNPETPTQLITNVDYAGTYTLVATGTNGCTASRNVVVPADTTSPELTATSTYNPITCSTTEITLSASSITPNVTWYWEVLTGSATITDENTQYPTVDDAGSFRVTATGDNGCTNTETVSVSTDYTSPVINNFDITPDDITCTRTTVTLQGSSTTGSTTYLWTTSGTGTITNPTTTTPTVNKPGTYTLTATYTPTGCTSDSSVTVGSNYALPNAVISPNFDTITCTDDSVQLFGNTSTGINHTWVTYDGSTFYPNNTAVNPIVTSAGWYILTVQHATSGCTDKDSVQVLSDSSVPSVTMNFPSTDTLNCTVDSAILSAQSVPGGTTYYWATNNGNFRSGTTGLSAVVDDDGTYSFIVTDNVSGCSTTKSFYIYEDFVDPDFSLSAQTLTCARTEVRINANIATANDKNNVDYLWTPGAGGNIVAGDEDIPNPRVTTAATYTLTLTDNINGCSASKNINVTRNTTPPSINIDKNPDDITCSRTTVSLEENTGQSNVSYLWTTTGSGSIANAITPTPTVSDSGWYLLTITSTITGCTITDSVYVDKNVTTPNISVNPTPDDITCSQTTVQLNGNSTDNVIYYWMGPGNIIVPSSESPDVDAAGVYTLRVTDVVNGCTNTATVTVDEDIDPPSAPVVNDTSICYGEANGVLTTTGATNVKWYSDASLDPAYLVRQGATYTPTVTSAGIHYYYVTQTGSVNGCESNATTAQYTIYALPSRPYGIDESICYNGGTNQPFLDAVPTGTNTISWYDAPGGTLLATGSSYQPNVSAVNTYTYYITQTNANGCEGEDTAIHLTIKALPSAPTVTDNSLSSCYSSAKDPFIAQGNEIKWYNSQPPATPVLTNNNVFTPSVTAAGTYTYYLTQTGLTSRCESNYTTVTYTIIPIPQRDSILGGGTYCSDQSGLEIYLNNSEAAATGTLYELWLNGNPFLTNIPGAGGQLNFGYQQDQGNYTAYATGANGCKTKMIGSASIIVDPLPGSAGTITGDSVVCQGISEVVYTVPEISNATTYNWSIPSGALIVSADDYNTITVRYLASAVDGVITVYGENSCGNGEISEQHSITVNNIPQPAGAITGSTALCQGATGVTYEITAIPNATSYVWTLPSGFTVVEGANSRRIVVDLDESSTGGIIRVYGRNSCGNGINSPPLTVTISDNPIITTTVTEAVCGTSTSLVANDPGAASINWILISGSGTIASPTSFSTTISNLGRGENQIEITLTDNSSSCNAVDTVTVTNNALFVLAGQDQTICSNTTTLNGNVPGLGGTGTWSVISGSASFSNANQYNSQVTNLAIGANVLRWTITKSGCSTYDEVTITNDLPSAPDAGINQSICKNYSQLNANNPVVGSGLWSIVKGYASFASLTMYNTNITNLQNDTNIFRWTIINNGCELSDIVTIINNQVTVNAGEDQVICSDTAQLTGSTPTKGIGGWSIIQGSGIFQNSNNPTSQVTNLAQDTNILRWTVTYNGCNSTDEVSITNNMPSYANAGLDRTIYEDHTYLNATNPTRGTGEWTLLEGYATIADRYLNNTEITNVGPGANTLQWLVEYEGCISADNVIINNETPNYTYAGADTTICFSTTILDASRPVIGTGEWSVITGGATFVDRFQYNTVVKDLAPGDNVLRWTVTGLGTTYDEVTITNNSPSTPHAGADRELCADSTSLAGNSPAIGTGVWTIQGGSALFEDSTLNNTKVWNLTKGRNTFRWTITNMDCPLFDEVVITNNIPTEADAGDDQTLCADSSNLYGNAPTSGTGLWTLISGSNSAVFDNQNEGNTGVSNLGQGTNIFRWTISNKNCYSYDEVAITNDLPTEPNAGIDQSICVDTFMLSANQAEVGTGQWTVINGYGTIDNASSNETIIRFISKGTNLLRWTTTHNECILFDEVEISFDIIDALAGNDQTLCSDKTYLQANNPGEGKGYWSVVAGSGSALFTSQSSPNTEVTELDRGTNILRWTITNKACISYDDVTVINNNPSTAYAGADKNICKNSTSLNATNPEIGTGRWQLLTGSLNITNETLNNTTLTDINLGANTLRWTVTNVTCTSTDEVTIYNNAPPKPSAGEDQIICVNYSQLYATQPTLGTGQWSLISGSAIFEDAKKYSTKVTGLSQLDNVIKWTVTNGDCFSTDTVIVTVNKPTAPRAGADQNVCSDTTVLYANYPGSSLPYNYYWEVVSGSGNFDNNTQYTTKVRNLSHGENKLRWVIEYLDCILADTVVINNNAPTLAYAGDDVPICNTDETQLFADRPEIGHGKWTVISGNAKFEDDTLFNTELYDIAFGANVLRWTTSFGNCNSRDEVVITNNSPEVSVAEDTVIYKPTHTLVGNQPQAGSGQWILAGGAGTIENATNFQTKVTSLGAGVNTFRWIITVDGCSNFDEVNIDYRVMPTVDFSMSAYQGCPPLTVQFVNNSTNRGGAEYNWDFGDGVQAVGEIVTHIYNQSGKFMAKLTTKGSDGSIVYKDTIIDVYNEPDIDFYVAPETVYIPEQQLQCFNNTVDGYTYLWDFGDSASSDEQNPIHIYSDTGTYDITLHVWSRNNCYNYLTKENQVQVIESGTIEFPSAFTPSGQNSEGTYSENDYSNDIFHPIVKGVDEYHLDIYNRWGVMVFDSDEVEKGWDGYYKGKPAHEDVYIFRVYGRLNNGRTFDFAKDFLLIRK